MTKQTQEKPNHEAAAEDAGAPDKTKGKPAVEAGSEEDKAGDKGAGQPYYPEKLPEHFRGKSDQETIDQLLKGYSGARDELAGKGKIIPKSADEYQLELPEEISKQVFKPDDSGKDPIFELAQSIALKSEMPLSSFQNFMTEFLPAAIEKLGIAANDAGAADGDDSMDSNFQSFGGVEKAKPVQDAAALFIETLKGKDGFDDNVIEELKVMSRYGTGLKVVMAMRAMTGEKAIPVNVNAESSDAKSLDAERQELMRSKDYWSNPQKQARVAEIFEQLFPEQK